MKTLIEKTAEKLQPTAKDWREYAELLTRDDPADAKKLAELCQRLGVAPDLLEVHRLVVREAARLQPIADEGNEHKAAVDQSDAARRAARDAHHDVMVQYNREILKIDADRQAAWAGWQTSVSAQNDVDVLQACFPRLFGLDRQPLALDDAHYLPPALNNLLNLQTKRVRK
jgi:hypothetical protein